MIRLKIKQTRGNIMIKCSMTHLKAMLPLYIKANRPVMVWGGPGEGKSGLVRSVVEQIGADLQDFRLLMRDAVDVHGLPQKNEQGRMSWAYPEEMPLATDKIDKLRVMFLDELPAAATSIQTVAYQMLHERAIDNTPLHENVRFIAAGNREKDGAVFNRMPTPLANRMAHFDVTADTPSWLAWGHKAGIHPFVLAHLENSSGDLRVGDEKEYLTSKTFRSPRTWEYTSDVIHEAMKGVTEVTDEHIDLIGDIAGSFVGVPTAANFTAYLKLGAKLPKTIDILEGKVKIEKYQLHQQFFMSCGLLSHLADERKALELKGINYAKDVMFTKHVDNLFNFVKGGFDAETLASFASRFSDRNWYGFMFNAESQTQAEFVKWLYSGKEGAARLVYAK
jgi:hypothetical protein